MTTKDKEPDYVGHRQRMRQRFLLSEGRDMADYELLELVLMQVIPRRDVKPLAKAMISRFGSFADVINAPNSELLSISGVKESVLTILKVIKTASLRTSWQTLAGMDAPIISNYDSMVYFCSSSMCFSDVEELRLIYLDNRLRLLGTEIMQKGTINTVSIHPREIIKAAMANHAAAIIMVHNHPSGDTTPSRADIEMTRLVNEACKSVSIRLCDHLIIGRRGFFSFSSNRLLMD